MYIKFRLLDSRYTHIHTIHTDRYIDRETCGTRTPKGENATTKLCKRQRRAGGKEEWKVGTLDRYTCFVKWYFLHRHGIVEL